MDALFANIGVWLLANGPGGIVAALAILALVDERKGRKEDRAALIDTLNRWRTDTQTQNDKVAALAEKVIVAIESDKRNG
jgi:hypothetical protein